MQELMTWEDEGGAVLLEREPRFKSGDRVSFNVDDAVRDGWGGLVDGARAQGRFLYVETCGWPRERNGMARVETNEVIDWDDDGFDETGPIMRPIYMRYYVPANKLRKVRDGS